MKYCILSCFPLGMGLADWDSTWVASKRSSRLSGSAVLRLARAVKNS